ncbi:hypothetical protein RU86_GL000556 [Lactococcus piscium]|uniref:Uncharacterized protein n=1 Tax=Pseudolactococcus piscium TaxID=1364 RepID=A0A2A5RX56_9LACT|nr:hypothetical protein RU86_GL000556 [Lactococcus piscium]
MVTGCRTSGATIKQIKLFDKSSWHVIQTASHVKDADSLLLCI